MSQELEDMTVIVEKVAPQSARSDRVATPKALLSDLIKEEYLGNPELSTEPQPPIMHTEMPLTTLIKDEYENTPSGHETASPTQKSEEWVIVDDKEAVQTEMEKDALKAIFDKTLIELTKKHDLEDPFVEIEDAATIEAQKAAWLSQLRKEFQEFAHAEVFAHSTTVAYGASTRTPGSTVSVEGVEYKVQRIETENQGLVGELLIPAVPTDNHTIYISWTGTEGIASLWLDTEHAPGAASYQKEETQILAQINDAVKAHYEQTKQKVNLVMTGHSLGGALAQNCFVSLQDAIVQHSENPESDETKKRESSYLTNTFIQGLQLGVWNSAGVPKAVAERSNENAAKLKKAGVTQSAYYGMVAGDMLQTVGQGSILSAVNPDDALVQILKVTGNEGYYRKLVSMMVAVGGTALLTTNPYVLGVAAVCGVTPALKATLDAHTAVHFNNISRLDEVISNAVVLRNSVPEDRTKITSLLNDKMCHIGRSALEHAARIIPGTSYLPGFASRSQQKQDSSAVHTTRPDARQSRSGII